MKQIKAPGDLSQARPSKFKVFLAGTIEMGNSEDWQSRVTGALSDTDIVVLNPRRDDWDSSWKQEESDPQFREQVLWELRAMQSADCILFHFEPGSVSPITLLELGIWLGSEPEKIVVHCPEGYGRKGNVDVTCSFHGESQATTLDDAVQEVRRRAHTFFNYI